jgi:hypothetical protein
MKANEGQHNQPMTATHADKGQVVQRKPSESRVNTGQRRARQSNEGQNCSSGLETRRVSSTRYVFCFIYSVLLTFIYLDYNTGQRRPVQAVHAVNWYKFINGPRGREARNGRVLQTGTTVTLINLFISLPVRRKEFERNAKHEFEKALALLNAYALGPCFAGSGVRLTVR